MSQKLSKPPSASERDGRTLALAQIANARKLPLPVTSLTTPFACSARSSAVPVCGAIPSVPASAFGVSTGVRSSASIASGSRDRVSRSAASPLLGRGLEPVELAQARPRALGDQVQEGERPGDRPAAADQAVGGIAAQGRQVVAIAEAGGGIGRPDGEEHGAGDAGAGDQAGRRE